MAACLPGVKVHSMVEHVLRVVLVVGGCLRAKVAEPYLCPSLLQLAQWDGLVALA